MKFGMIGLGKTGANMTEQEPDSLQLKMLPALRNQFGGHAVTLESGQQGLETGSPTP